MCTKTQTLVCILAIKLHIILLSKCQCLVAHGLQVSGIIVVGCAQMDTIVNFSDLQSLLPLARGLVERVQQVIALTALVQLLCIFLLKDRKRRWNVRVRIFYCHDRIWFWFSGLRLDSDLIFNSKLMMSCSQNASASFSKPCTQLSSCQTWDSFNKN